MFQYDPRLKKMVRVPRKVRPVTIKANGGSHWGHVIKAKG